MKQTKEPKDLRIQRANAIQGLIKTVGYRILLKEWQKVKEQAFNDLRNEAFSKDSLSERQKIYNQVSEWIDLPKLIIAEGEDAINENKNPEPLTFIKKSVEFIKRSY